MTLALAAAALVAGVLALLSRNIVTMRISFALVVCVALAAVFGPKLLGREARAAQCTDVAIRVGALPLIVSWIAAARIGYALSRKRGAESDSAPSAKDR